MTLKSVERWQKNFKNSIKYSMKEDFEQTAPAIKEYYEYGSKVIPDAMKTINQIMDQGLINYVKKSSVFKDVDNVYQSAISDLKSGKFYDPERTEEAMARSMGMDFDMDMDEDFDDMNMDSDMSDNDLDSAGSATISTEINNGVGAAVATGSSYVADTIKAASTTATVQNLETDRILRKGFSDLTASAKTLADFNTSVVKQHIDNSTKYFDSTTKLLTEQNAILKEMVEMQRNLYKSSQEKEKNKDQLDFSDIVSSNGVPDLAKYWKKIKNNFENESMVGSMFGMLNMAREMGVFENPLQFIPSMIGKSIIGESLGNSLKNLNSTVAGLFGTAMASMNRYGQNNSGLLGELANIFGIKQTEKKYIDTSKFNRGPMQYNGLANKSIIEVIPTYLRRIEAALTGGPERIYDFSSGRWKTVSMLAREFENKQKSDMNSAMYDLANSIADRLQDLSFKDKEGNNDKKRKASVAADFDTVLQNAYEMNGLFEGDIDSLAALGKISQDNIGIIKNILNSTNKASRMKLSSNIMNAKSERTEYMNKLESGENSNLALFNGALYGSKYGKYTRDYDYDKQHTQDLFNEGQSAVEGNSSLSQLEGIHKEVFLSRKILETMSAKTSRKVTKAARHSGRSTSVVDQAEKEWNNRKNSSTKAQAKNYWDQLQEEEEKKRTENINNTLKRGNPLLGLYEGWANWDFGTIDADDPNLQSQLKIRQEEQEKNKSEYGGIWGNSKIKKYKSMPGKTFGQKYRNAEGLSEKYDAVSGFIANVRDKPTRFMANLIDGVNNSIYDFFFENRSNILDKDGNKVEGFFNVMVYELQQSLGKFSDYMQDEIVSPLHDWMESILGTNFGKRVKNSFSDIVDKGKQMFKSAFSRVRKDINNNSSGDSNSFFGKIFKGKKADGDLAVPETGLYVLSKGEAVIPSDMNPFNKDKEIADRKKDKFRENKVIKDSKKYGIEIKGQYADGTVSSNGIIDRYNQFHDDQQMAKYGNIFVDTIKDLKDTVAFFANVVKDAASEKIHTVSKLIPRSKDEKNQEEAIDTAAEDMRKKYPDIVAAAAAGGAGGLLYAGPTGLLAGTAIGASIMIAKNSEYVKEKLFGKVDEITGKRSGGWIGDNKLVQRFLNPTTLGAMRDYGIVGGTVGAFTPFGIVGGALLGSAVGFISQSQTARNKLFGMFGEPGKAAQNALEKHMARLVGGTGLGALLGSVVVGGPFGMIGGALVGGALSFASTTDKFKDMILGTVDPITKKRRGGVLGIFKETMIDPMKERLSRIQDRFEKYMKDEIFKPIYNGLSVIPQTLKVGSRNMFNGIKDFITKKMGGGSFIQNRIRDLLGNGKGAILGAAGAGLAYGGVPGALIGGLGSAFLTKTRLGRRIGRGVMSVPGAIASGVETAGDAMRRRLIRSGNAENMTAQERLDLMNDEDYRFREYDEMLRNSNTKEISDFYEQLSALQGGHKAARTLKNQKSSDLTKLITTSLGLKTSDSKKLRNYIMENGITFENDGEGKLDLRDYLRQNTSLTKDQREDFLKQAGKLQDQYKKAKLMENDVEAYRQQFGQELEKAGITGIDINNKNDVRKLMRNVKAENEARLEQQNQELEPENDPETVTNKSLSSLNKTAEDILNLMQGRLAEGYEFKTPEEKEAFIARTKRIGGYDEKIGTASKEWLANQVRQTGKAKFVRHKKATLNTKPKLTFKDVNADKIEETLYDSGYDLKLRAQIKKDLANKKTRGLLNIKPEQLAKLDRDKYEWFKKLSAYNKDNPISEESINYLINNMTQRQFNELMNREAKGMHINDYEKYFNMSSRDRKTLNRTFQGLDALGIRGSVEEIADIRSNRNKSRILEGFRRGATKEEIQERLDEAGYNSFRDKSTKKESITKRAVDSVVEQTTAIAEFTKKSIPSMQTVLTGSVNVVETGSKGLMKSLNILEKSVYKTASILSNLGGANKNITKAWYNDKAKGANERYQSDKETITNAAKEVRKGIRKGRATERTADNDIFAGAKIHKPDTEESTEKQDLGNINTSATDYLKKSKRKRTIEKAKKFIKKNPLIPGAAEGTDIVKESGIAALSKGEAVVSAKDNPNNTETKTDKIPEKKESKFAKFGKATAKGLWNVTKKVGLATADYLLPSEVMAATRLGMQGANYVKNQLKAGDKAKDGTPDTTQQESNKSLSTTKEVGTNYGMQTYKKSTDGSYMLEKTKENKDVQDKINSEIAERGLMVKYLRIIAENSGKPSTVAKEESNKKGSGLFDILKSLFGGLKSIFGGLFKHLKLPKLPKLPTPTPHDIKEKGLNFLRMLRDGVGKFGDKIKDTKVGRFVTSIKDKATNLFNTGKDKIMDFGSSIKDKATNLFNTGKDKIADFGSSIKNTITDYGTKAADKASSVFSSIKDKATSLFDAGKDISGKGNEKVMSAISSIKSGLQKIADAAAKYIPANMSKKVSQFCEVIIKKVTSPEAIKKAAGRALKQVTGGSFPVLTVAMAAYSFYEGWSDAGKYFNLKSDQDPSIEQKIVAGFANAASMFIPVLGWFMDGGDLIAIGRDVFGIPMPTGNEKGQNPSDDNGSGAPSKGLLEEGWNTVKDFASNTFQAAKGIASGLYDSASNALSNIWSSVKSVGATLKDKTSNLFTHGVKIVKDFGTTVADKAGQAWDWAKDKVSNLFGNGKYGRSKYKYGKGGIDPSSFKSQLDPNNQMQYNAPGDTEYQTMADSGCGPGAAANTVSALGGNMDIKDAAMYSLAKGYKEKNGGTEPGFFKDILNKFGVETKPLGNDHQAITSAIKHGNPVILMGKDTKVSDKNPWGPGAHYVTATGFTDDGNVIIQDSESDGPNKVYKPQDVFNKASIAIEANRKPLPKKILQGDVGSKGIPDIITPENGKSKYGRGIYDRFTIKNYSKPHRRNYLFGRSKYKFGRGSETAAGPAIWQMLHQIGFNDIGAAGVMGNMMKESTLYSDIVEGGSHAPEITVDGTHGYGLCQWTTEDRQQGLVDYAAQQGKSTGDAGVQIGYLKHELDTSYSGTMEATNNASSPEEAASIFHEKYENSNDGGEGLAQRQQWAREAYDNQGAISGSANSINSTTATASGGSSSKGQQKKYSGLFGLFDQMSDQLDSALNMFGMGKYGRDKYKSSIKPHHKYGKGLFESSTQDIFNPLGIGDDIKKTIGMPTSKQVAAEDPASIDTTKPVAPSANEPTKSNKPSTEKSEPNPFDFIVSKAKTMMSGATSGLSALMSKVKAASTPFKNAIKGLANSRIGKLMSSIFGDNPFSNFFGEQKQASSGNSSGGSGGAGGFSSNPNIRAASEYANSRVGTEGYGGNGCTAWVNDYLRHANQGQIPLWVPDAMAASKGENVPNMKHSLSDLPKLPAWKDASQGGVEGDVAVIEYDGNRDNGPDHVVIADGQGGYWGNSSSRNQIVHSSMSDWGGDGIYGYISTGGDGSGNVVTGEAQKSLEERAAEMGPTAGGYGKYGRAKNIFHNMIDKNALKFAIKSHNKRSGIPFNYGRGKYGRAKEILGGVIKKNKDILKSTIDTHISHDGVSYHYGKGLGDNNSTQTNTLAVQQSTGDTTTINPTVVTSAESDKFNQMINLLGSINQYLSVIAQGIGALANVVPQPVAQGATTVIQQPSNTNGLNTLANYSGVTDTFNANDITAIISDMYKLAKK